MNQLKTTSSNTTNTPEQSYIFAQDYQSVIMVVAGSRVTGTTISVSGAFVLKQGSYTEIGNTGINQISANGVSLFTKMVTYVAKNVKAGDIAKMHSVGDKAVGIAMIYAM